MSAHLFTAAFLFAGLGAGARGFLEARGELPLKGQTHAAQFKSLGGVDIDPEACKDFELLTGSKATCADVSTMSPADLRAAWGDTAPDVVFTSPPCTGFSGLLPKKQAGQEKYQRLNALTLIGVELLLSTWSTPPSLIVLENVPRIQTRGQLLLTQVKQRLAAAGYRWHEGTHDCGEIGNLAQHRRRYLLVARLPSKVSAFVHRPPIRRVRACGEVLEPLPFPGDPAAGPMHALPKLSWLNWVRLSLIPPGGDWRDLPKAHQPQAENEGKHTAKMAVQSLKDPARTVTGGDTRLGSGAPAIADDRVAQLLGVGATGDNAKSFKGRPGHMGVADWQEPVPAITGRMSVSTGNATAAIQDPRAVELLAVGDRFNGGFGVTSDRDPAPAVTGSMHLTGTSAVAVADSLAIEKLGLSPHEGRYTDKFKVFSEAGPVNTVTSAHEVQAGAQSIADSANLKKLGLASPLERGQKRRTLWARWKVMDFLRPAQTVTGEGGTASTAIADLAARGKLGLQCRPWENSGIYGVVSWEAALGAVTGSASVDNGRFSVADPRAWDPRKPPPAPVLIIAKDGTWHRPLTTLELAVLQGLPTEVDGMPLVLAGKSHAHWRKRIGNAVPVGAGKGIAGSLLRALLASVLGGFRLDSEGVWVSPHGEREQIGISP